MFRKFPVSLRKRAILGGAVMLACRSMAMGGATFLDTSTASWRFDPDTSGGSDLKTLNLAPPPASSAMPAPPNYQFSKTFASGNSNSVAKGSIGYVANQTTATFTLAPGTGVTQSDPGNAVYKGDSMLRVNFDGFFRATSPSFGPLATGYVSVAVGGVVGAGGSARFTGQVSFLDTNGSQLRPTVNFDQSFNSAGSFAKTFTSSGGLNPITLATNTQFRVKGFFEFRASNHGSPSQISPTDFEAGSAPPTATWNVNKNGLWSDPNNWAAPNGAVVEDLGMFPNFGDGSTFFANAISNAQYNPPSIPVVPNGIGQRARFTSTLGGTHTITLGSMVTIGALDFGNNGNLNFTTGTGGFVMDTNNSGNASIQGRNTGGGKSNVLNTKIILRQDLDIETDGNYIPGDPNHSFRSNLYFKKNISGDQGINKNGDGNAFFDAANSYTGGTHLHGGKLNANAPGSLGTNDVDINDAQLNYNAKHAAKAGSLIEAFNGGQIDLGVVPANDENFRVIGLSAISGNSSALGALSASSIQEEGEQPGFVVTSHFSNHHYGERPPYGGSSSGAHLEIADGAMIGHESFDTGSKGNPKNLGNSPRFVFGISNDFGAPCPPRSITIGTNSGTPWIGFGSDRTERTFGVNPFSSSDLIRVKGAGSLVSLNETLWLNAKLVSVGSNASLDKYGKGTVAIENVKNDFHGAINVYEGGLLVNGKLPGLQSLSVYSGASLGGRGVIDGPVTIYDGAALNPGNIKPQQRAGTLAVDDLTLSDAAALNFDLDKPNKVGQGINDLLDVDGDLFLDGTLNVRDLGNFDIGAYTLIHFDGSITGPGLDLGTMPTDQFGYGINVVGHNVKLTVSAIAPLTLVTTLIPEPGVASMLMVIGCAGVMNRRKR